ncbi:MATE family efflux transporter [Candidatus Poribacteria bacterium]|nr:MATE family efflux transporter [Candidatus Poribacteria bacterium]
MENLPEEKATDILHRYPPGGYKQLLALAYPVIITMISQTAMWLADNMMVGRLGTTQFAAVGVGGSIVWTLFAFYNGLISSANTFISQDYGAKRYRHIGETVWHYIYLSLISYVFLIITMPFSSIILRWVSSSDEFTSYGNIYARFRLYAGLPAFISFSMAGFFRGIGNTKTPMFIAIFCNAFNILANLLLIFGIWIFPRLEVTGAALATLLSSVLSAVIYLIFVFSRKYNTVYLTKKFYRFNLSLFRRLIRVGLPMGVQFFLDSGSFTLFGLVIARMGEIQFAASNAAMSLMSTSFMPLVGISIATTTLVGQFIGAKLPEYARKSGYAAIKLGLMYACFTAVCFITLGRHLVAIIIKDPEVIKLGAKILILAGIFQISDAFGICSNGALRGAGDTRFIMFVGILYAWFLFIPLALLLGVVLKGGVVGAWIGATIYIIIYGITAFLRFRRGKWQSIKI